MTTDDGGTLGRLTRPGTTGARIDGHIDCPDCGHRADEHEANADGGGCSSTDECGCMTGHDAPVEDAAPLCAGCGHQHTMADGSCGVWSDDDGMCWCEQHAAPAEPDVAVLVGQDIQAAWEASQARITDEILDELETEERDAADALAEISALAATALRDLRRGEINPDVVMLGAVAVLREWLGRLDEAIGTTPAATVKSAPEVDRLRAELASETRRAESWRTAAGSAMRRVDELEAAQAHAAEVPAGSESPLVDVDPDSPAGRVAAQLAAQLGDHLSTISLGIHSGTLHACPAGRQLDKLRSIVALLPDETLTAQGGNGWLDLRVPIVRDGVRACISLTLTPNEQDEQAAARTWLAEIGVEVQ